MNVLMSLSNTHKATEFTKFLLEKRSRIIATSGTANYLRSKIMTWKIEDISALTKSPPLFEGRLKSLHSIIFSGLLYQRGHKDLDKIGAIPFDILNVNLYPFEKYVEKKDTYEKII